MKYIFGFIGLSMGFYALYLGSKGYSPTINIALMLLSSSVFLLWARVEEVKEDFRKEINLLKKDK